MIRSYKLKKVKCQIRSLAFRNQAERWLTHLIAEGLLQIFLLTKPPETVFALQNYFVSQCNKAFFFNKSFLYHTWWTVFRSCRCLQFLQASICSASWGHHASSQFILPHCTYFREMQALISVKLIPSMPRGLKCEFSKRLGGFPPKVDSYSANPCSYKVLFQFPSLRRSLAIIFLKKQTKSPNHLKAVSNKINSTYILQLLWKPEKR